MESKSDTLGEMVVVKWLSENHGARLHLEQYDSDKLHSLMLSRIRKLSREINEEQSREPMPIHTDSLDEIFDSILKSGLLVAVNPKVSGQEERDVQRKAAEKAQLSAEADFMLAIMQYEKAVGQRGISEWYHRQASKEQKAWFDRLFPSGATLPAEAPAAPSADLFIIKTTNPDGRIKYVCSDSLRGGIALNGDLSNAFRFGATRSNDFAERLARERPELKIEIVPV
jgi:hypothetical protein